MRMIIQVHRIWINTNLKNFKKNKNLIYKKLVQARIYKNNNNKKIKIKRKSNHLILEKKIYNKKINLKK